VYFVDTTILCNLLPVFGRDQDRAIVLTELSAREAAKSQLILPVAAVIETGNFIAQIADGAARRTTATLFSDLLTMICEDRAPWRLHQFTWGSEFLQTLITGANTGSSLIEHAQAKLGAADVSILAERDAYRTRTGIANVQIWSRDSGLMALS
jgi:hypothetical protein